jgi:phage terminase large subunit GpA-like protein
MAADVQRGKDKHKNKTTEEIQAEVDELTKKKDFKKLDAQRYPRLEVEVIGHGRDYRTASIIYKKFYGKLTDHTSGAWKKFTDWRNENPEGLKFKREDGFEFPIQMIFVDSGWSPKEQMIDVVYNYCHPWDRMYPIKGAGTYKQDKQKMHDITSAMTSDVMRFKLSKSGEHPIVLVHGNYYKGWIYRNFQNTSTRINDQPPNSHITPADYPDSYFEALRAEKQKTNGDFWNPAKKPNEALDLLVYNKAAADFFIQDLIIRLQEQLKIKFPKLKNVRSMEVREKLNELANREIVTDQLEAQLRDAGW